METRKRWCLAARLTWLVVLVAATGGGAARGDTAGLCAQNVAALQQLVTPDDLVEAFHETTVAAVENALEELGGVENEDRDALLTAARDLDFDSIELEGIAEPVVRVAKLALLKAIAEEMTTFPVDVAQKKLDGVLSRTRSYSLPKEPVWNLAANPSTCDGGRALLKEAREQIARWRAWQADLRDIAALPEYPPCRGLDSEEYERLASAFGQLVEPMTQMGLALDIIRGSGTAAATAYFTGFDDLGTTASQIADRIDSLSLTARQALSVGEQRFKNLSANYDNVLVPAVDAKCKTEAEATLKLLYPQKRNLPEAVIFNSPISVQCGSSSGQKCGNLWSQQVTLSSAGKITMVYNGTGNCSPVSFDLLVDQRRVSSTGLAGWNGSGMGMEVSAQTDELEPGQHVVQLQAYGHQQGCNSGRLLSYGGRVKLIAALWVWE